MSFSAQEHLDDLAYLIAHLGPDPVGTQFVPEAQEAFDALSRRMTEWSQADRNLTTTQAGMVVADGRLTNAVRTARDRIMEDANHDRHDRKMATYLPHGLAGVFTGSLLDQVNAVRVLASHCAQDPSPNLQALSASLLAEAEETKAAFDRRQDATVAEGTAYGNLRVEKLNATDTVRRIAHRLLEAYQNDRRKVNGFFRPVSRPRKNGARKTDAAVTSAPTPSGSPETPETSVRSE
jgi:hypothetical protein